MGYAQTLSRTFTLFNNAGVAFTILSPLTALTGVALSALHSLLIFWAVLAACAAANSAPNAALAYLTSLGALWNVVALAALVAALPALARQRNSAQYLFTRWQDMTEVGGFVYVLVLNSVALDARELLATDNESRGQHAVAQLFWNVHKAAYGDGRGGLALLSIPTLAALMCTYESIGANARMLFAFSRDGAVPFNKYIGRVEERTKAPVVAVWVMAGLAAVLGTPMFFSPPYVATVETMAVVNTYIAYGIPIACKLLSSRAAFLPGPYSMRPWLSRCLNALALLWIAFIAVVFSLPTLYPITPGNMNYNAAGTVLVLLLSLGGYYCPVVGGRHWFTGPRPSLGQFREDVAAEQQKAAAMAKHLMLQQGQAPPGLEPQPEGGQEESRE
eukprot:XP_001692455.1 amino acid carrier 2 [Chlamydomonas reinhardtii]